MSRPRLLLTRPARESGATAAAALAAGFEVLQAPLLDIRPLPISLSPGADPDALLFTSAHAPALAGASHPELKTIPAYAVGPATAAAATAAGFEVAATGQSDGSAIVARAAADGRRHLLHLAGEATAALAIPPGLGLTRVPVYAADLAPCLPAAALRAFREDSLLATLLFSPRTARHFRTLLDAAAIEAGGQRIVAISAAAADAAGTGWRACCIAAAPTTQQALAAAHALWQGLRHG